MGFSDEDRGEYDTVMGGSSIVDNGELVVSPLMVVMMYDFSGLHSKGKNII